MSALVRWMDRHWYPGDDSQWDNRRFRARVLATVQAGDSLLDYGAGRGAVDALHFRGMVRFAAGVDLSNAVLGNAGLDEARLLEPDGRIPFPDCHFDLVVSANVLEHVDEPRRVFSEVFRVLRPGGRFIAKTPNAKHYVPLIANCTPTGFHRWVNRLRGRPSKDTFPTRYRCNTPRPVAHHAASVAFQVALFELWEGRPEYLRLLAPLYLAGHCYERVVNRFEGLAEFRAFLVFELIKPG